MDRKKINKRRNPRRSLDFTEIIKEMQKKKLLKTADAEMLALED